MPLGERAERAEGVTLLAVVEPGDIVIAAKPYGEVALTSSTSTSWRSTRATTAATGGGCEVRGQMERLSREHVSHTEAEVRFVLGRIAVRPVTSNWSADAEAMRPGS